MQRHKYIQINTLFQIEKYKCNNSQPQTPPINLYEELVWEEPSLIAQ